MKFLAISIDGYKIFEQKSSIPLVTYCSKKNIILIGALNGAGKTSFKDAVEICLYGEKPDVIWSLINHNRLKNGEGCSLELEFEDDEENNFVVHRSWTLRKGTLSEELDEKLMVRHNGIAVPYPVDMWKDYVDLHFPREVTQFFFFDGEKILSMAADNPDKNLRSSLEAALGFDLVKMLEADILNVIKDEESKRKKINAKEIEWRYKQIESLEQVKQDTVLEREQKKEEILELEQQINSLKSEFKSLIGFDIDELQAKEEKQREEVKLNSDLSGLEKDMQEFIKSTLPLALLSTQFRGVYDRLKLEGEMTKNRNVHELAPDLAKKVVAEIEMPFTICCNRSLTEWERDTLLARVEDIISEFGRVRDFEPVLQLSDSQERALLSRIEQIEVKWWESHFDQKIKNHHEIKNRLNQLKQELVKSRIRKDQQAFYEEFVANMESFMALHGSKTRDLEQNQNQILKTDEEIKNLRSQLDEAYRQYDDSNERETFLQQTERILNLLSEYKEVMCGLKIGELEKHTLHMLQQMLRKQGRVANLKIDPKTFTTTLTDTNGDVIIKDNMSAGEKLIYTLSLLWGLGQTSKLNLPIIIDTPLSRLDSIHRNKVIANYYPNAGHQVIILSTDTEIDIPLYKLLQEHIQETFVFVDNGGSTMVQKGYFMR